MTIAPKKAAKQRRGGPSSLCPDTPAMLRERDDSGRTKTMLASKIAETENPTWTQIEAALRRLDNAAFTDVSLEYGSGVDRTVLSVGGGHADRVICTIARPDDPDWDQAFRHVVDPGHATGTFDQMIGGQRTSLPARLSVPLPTALDAARYFYKHRGMNPALTWEVVG
jgi:hypothetical protein